MKKTLVLLFVFSFWFLASPSGVFAQTATLSLDPKDGTLNKGCNVSLNINLDTGGVESDGVDVILLYDTSRLTATSVTKGTLFAEYPGSNIDTAAGKVSILALASVDTAFSGKGTFATVNFTVPATAPTGTTLVSFDFDGNDRAKTTDSNVVQRGTTVDVLGSVVNGSYVVGTGSCSAQATPAPSALPGSTVTQTPAPRVVTTQPRGGYYVVSTPAAQQGQPKTLDQYVDNTGKGPGTPQTTFAIAIIAGVLTVLGILGLALL